MVKYDENLVSQYSSWGAKKHILLYFKFFYLVISSEKNGISSKKFPNWGGGGGVCPLGNFPHLIPFFSEGVPNNNFQFQVIFHQPQKIPAHQMALLSVVIIPISYQSDLLSAKSGNHSLQLDFIRCLIYAIVALT